MTYIQTEEAMTKIFNNTHDAIIIHDLEGNILEVNDRMCELYNIERNEAVTCNVRDMSSPSMSFEELSAIWDKVLHNDKQVFEWEAFRPRDKSIFFVEVSLQKMELSNESLIIANIRDITDRKQQEEALRRSENYYRAIFETSGAATVIIEEDGTIVLANFQAEKLCGFSRSELEGKKYWSDFVHPQDLEKMRDYHFLRKQDPDAAPKQYEFRLLDRWEHVRHIFYTIDIIPGTGQSVGSLIDITKRKEMEEALKTSEKRYKQERNYFEKLLENSADAIGIMDERGRITRWNKRAAKISGFLYQEMLGRHFSEFYADREEMQRMLSVLRQHGEVNDYEVNLVRKEGQAVPCSVSISVLKNEEEETIGSISIIRDLSEWKETLRKLEEMSIRDYLTGLYNRNFFEEEMQRLSDGRYAPVSLIICDLDELKLINDTQGHQAGDEMLIQAAEILRSNFRSSDIVARIGGDEFAVLLTQTGPETAKTLIDRLQEALEKFNRSSPLFPLSLSMGYAVAEKAPMDMQALFREADNRMYRDKAKQ